MYISVIKTVYVAVVTDHNVGSRKFNSRQIVMARSGKNGKIIGQRKHEKRKNDIEPQCRCYL